MVTGEDVGHSEMLDETLRYLASTSFTELNYLGINSLLYMLKDKKVERWPKVTNCQFGKGRLSEGSGIVVLRVLEMLERSSP